MFMAFLFILPMRIDHAAHIGGLMVGALLGMVVDPGEPKTPTGDQMLWLLTALALLATLGSFALMALAYPVNVDFAVRICG
jgi:hypothetical protein